MLDEAGVRGAYRDDENDGTRKYYRCLKDVDITLEPNKVEDVVKDAFKNLAMKVVVGPEPEQDSDVDNWIDGLRELHCLHFEK